MSLRRAATVLSLAAALAATLLAGACVRTPAAAPAPTPGPGAARPPLPPAEPGPAPTAQGPAWPAIVGEPELAVMVQRGPSLHIRLLVAHRLPGGGELPAGGLDLAAAGDGVRVGGRSLTAPIDLEPVGASGATFSADGARFGGRLRLARRGNAVEVIERVPLERWLAGVLPAEMDAGWPVEALGAQAIVARSYAVARWQARPGESWHLLRGTADVAYDGFVAPSSAVAAAIAATRGRLLVHDGMAVLARFHAASGGRTEDSDALWPGATLVDGRTPLERFSAAVEDPASVEGARALGWTRTHQQWRAAFTTAELSESLATWSRGAGRPRIGSVVAVAIAARQPSDRVARVTVTHRLGGSERRDEIDAREFRLAVGANRLRSLWWEKAVMAEARGGQLVVEGRGFGHGVGLSQVGAWWLARDGRDAAEIVRRYFPGAALVRLWR
jgi:SpoIID/LytB domain protein